MTLTQSIKEQFLDECNSLPRECTENEDNFSVIFYHVVNGHKLYSVAAFLP
jgi:hypothetical protein